MEYLLGTGDEEFARLEFPHEVWGERTRAFLDRVGVRAGARVLDVGCGPGFVSLELAERVGAQGRVVALDESPRWRELLEVAIQRRGLSQMEARTARLEEAALEPGQYDLIFARWVLSFVPDPRAAVVRLAGALAPGGVLAVQDYNHEGLSLFPRSEGFIAAVRALREWYSRSGGDVWVAGRLPSDFQAAGLESIDLKVHVLAGPPGSPAHRWADSFFPFFVGRWAAEGLMSAQEESLFRKEWEERKLDPGALFFSPMVVDLAARQSVTRPSPAP
jgi:SAM-dependent methyltransferase